MPDPSPTPSPTAQRLMDEIVKQTAAPNHRNRRRALGAARQAWLSRSDPAIEHRIGATSILLPMSHQLPVYRATYPDYSLNLGRIAALTASKHPGAGIVDIGANVGDSAAIVRATTDAPILCVEGDAHFLPFLEVNSRRLADVEIARTYVRTAGITNDAFRVVREGGTARLEPTVGADVLSATTTPLADILDAHPRFARPALIKIDTDGQDAGILADAESFLEVQQPALFFEFDPTLTATSSGHDALEIFAGLARAGYRRALFFTNRGAMVIGLNADEWDEVCTLAEYAGPGEEVAYFDVCAFGPDATDLAAEVEQGELDRRRRR